MNFLPNRYANVSIRPIPAALILACLLLLTATQIAGAETIFVTTDADGVVSDTDCSLREAINNANANSDTTGGDCAVGEASPTVDVIVLDVATYGLTDGVLTISDDLTINGVSPSKTKIDGMGNSGVFVISNFDAIVEFSRLTITGGYASSGGGIHNMGNLTITECAVSGNSALGGGGILNAGALVVTKSTISNNVAAQEGGGLFNRFDANDNVTRSSRLDQGSAYVARATLVNSTISGNQGGGIVADLGSDVELINVTVTDNDGGGIVSKSAINDFPSVVTFVNTIIVEQSGGADCVEGDNGNFTSRGNNLDSDDTCSLDYLSDLPGNAKARLGPLQGNGGPTETHALLDNSKALDKGNVEVCAGGPVNNLDQRGVVRPQGPKCDIGAYEAFFYDFGDAPDTYGTTKSANGAYHLPSPLLRLGSLGPDTETDGQPTGGANGDDLSISDDEDALTTPLPVLYDGTGLYQIDGIPVFNNTETAAILAGWIDIDGNGQFDNDEMVMESVPSDPSVQNISLGWSIGSPGATPGQSYLRLRLFAHEPDPAAATASLTDADPSPTGDGGIGEVEDYPLQIVASGSIVIRKITTPAGGKGFEFTQAFSVDGDFFLDDGASHPFTGLEPGTYEVAEKAPTALGYALTELTCDDGQSEIPSIGNLETRTATIKVEAGETVTCTFVNSAVDSSTITFHKFVDEGFGSPEEIDASPSDWTFDVLDASGQTVAAGIADGETVTLAGGVYSVIENGPSGYGISGAAFACSLGGDGIVLTVDGQNEDCYLSNTAIRVHITESFLVTSLEEGFGLACYWINLSTYPGGGNVVVDIGPAQNGQVVTGKQQVTLNAGNWNSQTTTDRSNFVCVTAVDDQIEDSGSETCMDRNSDMLGNGFPDGEECGDHTDTIPHVVAGATVPGYNAETPFMIKGDESNPNNQILVLIRDDDTAGVTIAESYAVSHVDEDSNPVDKACYWITLNSQPLADVTVQATADNAEVRVEPTSLILTAANWNMAGGSENRICVLPINESDVDLPDPRCVTGSSQLLGQPGDGVAVCGTHLGTVTHSVTSPGDPVYDAIGANAANFSGNGIDPDNDWRTVNVLVRDDDEAQVRFNPTNLNVVEGSAVTYDLWLTAKPSDDVTIQSNSNFVRAVDIDGGGTTVFTPANWNQPQTMTVEIADDQVATGPLTRSIEHSVASGDANFNGVATAPVVMTVVDNDAPGVIVTHRRLNVAEGGEGQSYGLRLTTQPSADVTVQVSSDGQAEAGSPAVTFTPANWNVEQTQAVSAVDDAIDESSDGETHAGKLSHSVTSDDSGYNGLSVGDLPVLVSDNDTAAVVLVQPASIVIAEGGDGTSYGLMLATQPQGAVTVNVTTDGQSSVVPASLTFDAGNWNVAKTVSVTAVDDALHEESNHSSLISHEVIGEDGRYSGLSVDSIELTVNDNDVSGVSVSPTLLGVRDNGTDAYSLVLASRPRSSVAIDLLPDARLTVDATCTANDEGTPCLIFTPDNWNVPQQVGVTRPGSVLQAFITHEVSSGEARYLAVDVEAVKVVREDENGQPVDTQTIYLPLINR